jgi:ELWxxDGT repeat protein
MGDSEGTSAIWQSDGTWSGTHAIDISRDVRFLAQAEGGLIFASRNESGSIDLWETDGTRGGTRALRLLEEETQPVPEVRFIADASDAQEFLVEAESSPSVTLISNIAPLADAGQEKALEARLIEEIEKEAEIASLALEVDPFEPVLDAPRSRPLRRASPLGQLDSSSWICDGDFVVTRYLTAGAPLVDEAIVRLVSLRDGMLVFEVAHAGRPTELWASNGTTAGTARVDPVPRAPDRDLASVLIAALDEPSPAAETIEIRDSDFFSGLTPFETFGVSEGL